MTARVEAALGRRIASANALLARAVSLIRDNTEAGIECSAEIDDPTTDTLSKSPKTRAAIIYHAGELALIREIETHLGFVPSPGPEWLDEVIEQGPDWAGPAS